MPKKKGDEVRKTYSVVNNVYVIIILVLVMGITILGAIAFPYYISPITYSNGGTAQAGGIAVLAALIILGLILGVYFVENKNYDIGTPILILMLVIIVIYVWLAYGSAAIKFIFNMSG
ncbi:hypothetical protein [Sulfolobus acidocaldarius]|nr:hypothetical protein [Sulfolobus acidocaldarius]